MSAEQPSHVTFYFDTTNGKVIQQLLRGVGIDVRNYVHLGLSSDADDKEWIAACGKHEWVIISGDKNISRIPEERQAVIDARCKVFMFDDSDLTRTEDWAASLLVARKKILEVASRTNGPYFALVRPCRVAGHVHLPDFVAGGGWKPESEWPKTISPPIQHPPRKARRNRERQASIDFPTHTALHRRIELVAHCDLCARLLGI